MSFALARRRSSTVTFVVMVFLTAAPAAADEPCGSFWKQVFDLRIRGGDRVVSRFLADALDQEISLARTACLYGNERLAHAHLAIVLSMMHATRRDLH